MPQFKAKASMNRGEVIELAHSRMDTETYRDACGRVFNWVTLAIGGVRRRSGSRYPGLTTKNHGAATYLEFVLSADLSYNLELGDNYMRILRADGTDTGVELATPWTVEEAREVDSTRINDVLYLTHWDHQPRKLLHYDDTDWDLELVDFYDGPYEEINDNREWEVNVGSAATTGSTPTLTWSTVDAINEGNGFTATDVDRWVRFQIGGAWFVGRIQSVTDATTVVAEIIEGFSNGDKIMPEGDDTVSSNSGDTGTWRLGMFGDDPVYTGWPHKVDQQDGRLVTARLRRLPRTVFLGKSDYPELHQPSDADGTVSSDHAFWKTVNGRRSEKIEWLQEGDVLLVGMPRVVRQIKASDSSEAMGPRNVKQQIAVQAGASAVPPVQIDASNLFISTYRNKLHDLYYDSQFRSFTAPNISTVSAHLLRSKVKRLAYQEDEGILWLLRDDGKLVGVTLEKHEKVIGYHHHDVSGFIEDIISIPAADRDVTWIMVRREIDGQTVRYHEILDPQYEEDLYPQEDAFFVDCGHTYKGPALNVIPGFGHLEGETVQVYADGAALPDLIVSGGNITLPSGRTAETVTAGLAIPNAVELLTPQTNSRNGDILDIRMRVVSIIIRVYQTLGLKVGVVGRDTQEVIRRKGIDPVNTVLGLFSGNRKVNPENAWEDGARVQFSVDQPLPATVMSVNTSIETE